MLGTDSIQTITKSRLLIKWYRCLTPELNAIKFYKRQDTHFLHAEKNENAEGIFYIFTDTQCLLLEHKSEQNKCAEK